MAEETIALTQRPTPAEGGRGGHTDRRVTPAEAGWQLGLTPRQVKRLVAAYRARGAAGLVTQRVGQPSNRRLQGPLRETIRALLVERFPDFGPTLAQEKLYELHQIKVSIETVRQHQVELGLWKPKRRQAAPAFQWRERRGRFGELIQIDGSPHAWFEGGGPRCTLIVFIDDATGRLVHARTRTPQAKGRVERANQTLQDRLVKELRLRRLSDLDSANAYLPAFIADFNPRFAVAPSVLEDAHRPLRHSLRALDPLLAEQEKRTLPKNLTMQYHNVAYQLRHAGPGYRLGGGAKVTVCALANGEVVLLREGRELPYTTYRKGERPPPVADEKTRNERVDGALEQQQRQRAQPAPDHPWGQAGAMAAARTATSPAAP